MFTILPAVLSASDPQVVTPDSLSTALQGMLLGVLVALFATAVVLARAMSGLAGILRSVLGPPAAVFTVLSVLALVLLAGNAGANP
ncbi:hypothetical protein EIL87_21305 [Saccharopolyspora rhizosphaerae]|uniref:Uncharacterized protein n=1 Tax=Saccharopolyspora rhizosphaerae TaxID=2492662 RepID=A0A426JM21_9PSEU|nr:hypothetical protein [Saccharopolyspora rhizosphaerae]RRO14268.1 hypothetical protein EIL87_21305 [Saccharopolyspora rhizosphaerae]